MRSLVPAGRPSVLKLLGTIIVNLCYIFESTCSLIIISISTILCITANLGHNSSNNLFDPQADINCDSYVMIGFNALCIHVGSEHEDG